MVDEGICGALVLDWAIGPLCIEWVQNTDALSIGRCHHFVLEPQYGSVAAAAVSQEGEGLAGLPIVHTYNLALCAWSDGQAGAVTGGGICMNYELWCLCWWWWYLVAVMRLIPDMEPDV